MNTKIKEIKFGNTVIIYSQNLVKRTYEEKDNVKDGYEVIYKKNIVKIINFWKNGLKVKKVYKNKNKFRIDKFVTPKYEITTNILTIYNQQKISGYPRKNLKKEIIFFSSTYTKEGIEDILILLGSKKERIFLLPLWERWSGKS